jgi:hypothetical protein
LEGKVGSALLFLILDDFCEGGGLGGNPLNGRTTEN